jgi:hypothetical protein
MEADSEAARRDCAADQNSDAQPLKSAGYGIAGETSAKYLSTLGDVGK